MANLEKYRQAALELGAARAAIVKTSEIPVEEAVMNKCRNPICFGYGASPHCAPHAMKPAELRELLKGFEYAVLFAIDVPAAQIVSNKDREKLTALRNAFVKDFEIVLALEGQAFYDGYYKAFGFGAGTCRRFFCFAEPNCAVLEGNSCRHPILARSAMEAVGIDVYKLVARQGWDIYPVGEGVEEKCVEKGNVVGIVIVK